MPFQGPFDDLIQQVITRQPLLFEQIQLSEINPAKSCVFGPFKLRILQVTLGLDKSQDAKRAAVYCRTLRVLAPYGNEAVWRAPYHTCSKLRVRLWAMASCGSIEHMMPSLSLNNALRGLFLRKGSQPIGVP